MLVAMLGCGMQKVDADGDGDGDVDGDVEVVVINASGRCGVERWAVKTGTDSTSNLVNLTPQDTTVTSLRAQAMPTSIPSTTRLPTSAETQVWRVSATLTSFKLENDSDIHLVLTDSSGATMIAEIPSTNCDAGSAWATQIAHSRNAFAAKFTASTSFQQANVPVVVTGIGMFDFAHGQTGAAPNQIELHPVFDICFPGSTVSGCGATSQDFTLSASPTALTTAAGASATSSISIAGSGGFAGTVALAASGVPAGASSSLTPANVAAGGNSTLMLSAGSASPGLYQVTVTGTAAGITHNATLMWTIGGSTGSGLVNGGFETGDLTGWRSTGPTSVVSSGAHSGTHAAQVGSTAPTNDSTITQSVTLPAGSPQLSFWFKNVCPDTLQFDWATVTVTSPAGTALATPLAKTCTNTDTWVNVTSDLSSLAGQTVVLTFANHDDNNSGDPTFTLYDDVQIAGGQQSPDFTISVSPPSVSSAGGAAATASVSVAALNGFTGPVSLSMVVPSGASAMFSPTTLTTGNGSSTVTLSPGTAAPGSYNLQISAIGVGITHTANLAWTIGGSTGSGLVNGGFETGDLTGWPSTGSTSVVSSGAHSGMHAAQVGSTAPTNDSTITQSVTLPGGSPQLSFWFKNVCPDTLQFDWATVTVTSPAGTVLATPLAKRCTNTDTWVNVTSDLSSLAGQTVVLTFANHDDNNSGDPTFTLYDDVQIAGGQQSPDFTLSVSPPSVSSTGGAAATASVSVAALNGFTGPVSLSTVVPSGASVMFSPTTLTTGTGSSTVTLSTGTAAPGIYNLQISAVGVGITHTANLAWTIGGNGTRLQTVFLIVMENHNWSSIKNSPSAPYINNTLLPMGAHAENYVNVAGIHPSEPNYLWLEAGTNFGVLNDNNPSSNHQSTTSHLVTQLEAAGITWKSYQEGITGTSCPLTTSGLYAPKHNPMVYFDDVTNTNSSSAQRCVQHVRPYTELASDLQNQTVSRYNFITPNLCNDMHNSSGCATSDSIRNGDSWLSTEVPKILASAAYQNGGVLLITWDESEGGDFPIGLIALSPKVKSPGFSNTIPYNHGSTLRTVQEIFGVTPLLGGAATSTDLGDLFQSFP